MRFSTFSYKPRNRIFRCIRTSNETSIVRRVFSLSSLLAVSMFLTGGCGIWGQVAFTTPAVREIPEEVAASVRAGDNTIVILRLTPRIDNILVMTPSEAIGPERPFILLRANLCRREEPTVFRSFSSSEDAATGNWIYFLVPPGAYWVGVLTPPYDGLKGSGYLLNNNFYLDVPGGVPLLYAGTLSASCTSSWGIFSRGVARCDDVLIEDESEAAETAARRDFGMFGQMETILLRHMNRGYVAKKLEPLFPMGLAVNGSPPVSTPDWRFRGVYRALMFGDSPAEDFASFMTGGGPGLSFAYLLYLPLGTVGGLIGGSHSDWKWGPCMDNIVEHVSNISPTEVLRKELMSALTRRGLDNISVLDNTISVVRKSGKPQVRSLIEFELQGLEIRECQERWAFSAYMKVRARLLDLARTRTLYDGILVYSSSLGIPPVPNAPDRMPYERFASESAVCRPIEEYCSQEGAEVFVGDLERATRSLVKQLLDEMGLGLHPSEENRIPVSSEAPSLPTSSIR